MTLVPDGGHGWSPEFAFGVLAEFSGNFSNPRPSKPMSSPGTTKSAATGESRNSAEALAARGLRPDVALLQRAQAGDRGAYGQIVLLYQDRLFNAVLRLVGDFEEARELTQEAFTRGLMKLDSFRGDAAPYTWLFRIAVNLAISQLRKVQRNRVFSLDRPNVHGRSGNNGRFSSAESSDDQASGLIDRVVQDRSEASPPERAEARERNEAVLVALGRLDAEYRAVLVMRDIEGFDYQQMADVLGLPLGTLKSRLFRARLALRDELKAYMAEK
jgi:RNA polymerase sigma-70 factor, ECF subfamily